MTARKVALNTLRSQLDDRFRSVQPVFCLSSDFRKRVLIRDFGTVTGAREQL